MFVEQGSDFACSDRAASVRHPSRLTYESIRVNPLRMNKKETARFWAKVDRRGSDDCWVWTAGTANGYGHFSLKRKTLKAHRISFSLNSGKAIPRGLMVCHKCDNPPCVNPAHLFLGTCKENINDARQKGRHSSATPGEEHPRSKLSNQAVADIRRLFGDGRSKKSLAKQFAIGRTQIQRIIKNESRRYK